MNEIIELWKEWCEKERRLSGEIEGHTLKELLFNTWNEAFEDGRELERDLSYPNDYYE